MQQLAQFLTMPFDTIRDFSNRKPAHRFVEKPFFEILFPTVKKFSGSFEFFPGSGVRLKGADFRLGLSGFPDFVQVSLCASCMR
jgi:hypothetical protein